MKNKKYVIEAEIDGYYYYYGLGANYLPEQKLMSSNPLTEYEILNKNIRGFNSSVAAQRIIDDGSYFRDNVDNIKLIELTI